jgi:hypothetical protein
VNFVGTIFNDYKSFRNFLMEENPGKLVNRVEVAFFFVIGLETFQILVVEISTGGLTESNVRSF